MMMRSPISRRTVLRGATALGALVAASPRLSAQQAPARSVKGPAAPLPPRGEFIIRDATILTMDPKINDRATGSVFVQDGAIVAIGTKIESTSAQIIDGRGMI